MAIRKIENQQELINLVNEFKALKDEKKMRRLLNSLSA